MGTGAEIAMIGLAVASVAAGAVTTMSAVDNADKMRKAQIAAANANLDLQNREMERQKKVVDQVAQSQKSDRMIQADQQMAHLQVTASESGLSMSTMGRIASGLSYMEGLDLSRIDSNAVRQKEQIDAGEAVALQNFKNVETGANNQASAAESGAWMGFAGTALQVGSKVGGYYRKDQSAQNLYG